MEFDDSDFQQYLQDNLSPRLDNEAGLPAHLSNNELSKPLSTDFFTIYAENPSIQSERLSRSNKRLYKPYDCDTLKRKSELPEETTRPKQEDDYMNIAPMDSYLKKRIFRFWHDANDRERIKEKRSAVRKARKLTKAVMPAEIEGQRELCNYCGVLLTAPTQNDSCLSAQGRKYKRRYCLGCARFTDYLDFKSSPQLIVQWLLTGKQVGFPISNAPEDPQKIKEILDSNCSSFFVKASRCSTVKAKEQMKSFIRSVSEKKVHHCAITGHQIHVFQKQNCDPVIGCPPWSLWIDYQLPSWQCNTETKEDTLEVICDVFANVKMGTCTNEEVKRWFEQLKSRM
ncbi:hypothetical protein A0J61_00111 [Choanephora cucurbitarum]|uniref:Uncharacterized protein n=1 Tax=Choanephora cucurbitarum TaxID=101091 RepID=A0A1C7NSA1_9FUNG|nr:hypothetical protein A0J61_00111 [Choanephora cucurbitarum]